MVMLSLTILFRLPVLLGQTCVIGLQTVMCLSLIFEPTMWFRTFRYSSMLHLEKLVKKKVLLLVLLFVCGPTNARISCMLTPLDCFLVMQNLHSYSPACTQNNNGRFQHNKKWILMASICL